MTHIRIGLRFKRSDAPKLRTLAARQARGELGPGTVAVYANAAQAAERGEPMEVHCTDPDEAIVLAEGYVLRGINRPAVEPLDVGGAVLKIPRPRIA